MHAVTDLVGDWRLEDPSGRFDAAVAPDDVAVLIPTSGTTGRSKLVMQTHRAYAMAGEGFPYWMELDRTDRLMTSLPLFHVNAPAYSVLGSLAGGAGLVLLPRFSASGFLDAARRHARHRVQRHRRDAGDPVAAAAPTRRRRHAAATLLHRPVTRAGLAGGLRGALRPADRLRVRDVRVTVRADLAARHPTVRHPRDRCGSIRRLGVVNEARVIDDDDRVCEPGEVGELQSAQSDRDTGLLGHAGRDRGGAASTAGCTPATW